MKAIACSVAGLLLLAATAAEAATLERIKSTGKLVIGYRTSAVPFSYRNEIGEAAGYTVDLCRAVAGQLRQQLGLPNIALDYVPVSATDRFEALASGKIDLLCGATTATLARREKVDFSIATFVTGASVVFRADGPRNFQALAGQKIGVTRGTTTETDLQSTLKTISVKAQIVGVKDHNEGFTMLQTGGVAAYFGDRAILAAQLAKRPAGQLPLRLSPKHFSIEPYALAMARGDSAFRLEVDRALSRIYRSGLIAKIYGGAFGSIAPGETVQSLYLINALPE